MIKTLAQITCLLTLFIPEYSHATKIFAPERLFKNTEVNVSEGDLLYKSQAAGYYSGGGGVIVRSPVQSTQFASVHLPKIQAGCGGIDIYTGGFSFISGEELVKALQAVSSNAAAFSLMLGIESVSPQIANNIRQMQSWANTINGYGINSCEASAQLVGSVWPANEMASQHICRTIGTSEKVWSDYTAARHGCSKETGFQALVKDKNMDPLSGEYNIVWQALMAQPFFSDEKNKDLAEMYMTIVGTFIVKDRSVDFKFAKAEDGEFLRCLLEGGKASIYTCVDKEKCLIVKERELTLTIDNSWITRVRNTLQNIQLKIINDEHLDNEEKGLLNTSRLPLYKIVNVMTAYRRGQPCPVEINNIADLVAWDVLAQVINEAIESVRRGCEQLRYNTMYETAVLRCLEDLDRVRKIVKRYEDSSNKALDLEMRLIQKLQLLENQINSEIIIP